MTIQQYVFKRGKIQLERKFPTLNIALCKKTCQNGEVAKSIKIQRKRQPFTILYNKVLQSLLQIQKAQKIGKKIEIEICYLSVSKSKLECFNRSAFDNNRETNYLKTFNCPQLRGKTNRYILNFHDEMSQNVPFFQSYLRGKTYSKA